MNELHFPPTPREVHIAITGQCNLSCKHCSYAPEMASLPDLPTESWLEFFEELEACKVMKVILTGGEPFVRKDLFQLIDSIVQHKMRFSLTTNATLITEATAQYLKACRRLDNIQVSIEGSKAETHEQLRGKGSFEPTLQGLQYLIAANLPVSARVTVTPFNLDDLQNICHMLIGLGVTAISINECYPFGKGQNNYKALALDPEQYIKAIKILVNFNKNHPGMLCGQAGPYISYSRLKEAQESMARGKPLRGRGGYLSGCGCVFQSIAVLHNGQYVPCQQISNIPLGKININSLTDVWNNASLLQMFRSRQKQSVKDFEECLDCRYQAVCTGGCPAQVFKATGLLNKPDLSNCYRTLQEKGVASVI